MWVTPDGRQHVLALPDPADVLSPTAFTSFALLVAAAEPESVGLLLDDRLLALSETGFEPDVDGSFVERAPAEGLLDGNLSTIDGLDAALAPIDPRWQVDLIIALHHLLETLAEETP